MIQRNVHITAEELFSSLNCKSNDFGDIALIAGRKPRAEKCLQYLDSPIKNCSFWGFNFWTGTFKGKKITVGNGGSFSPDTAIAIELLSVANVNSFIRIGTAGSLREDINIGDYVCVDSALPGEGTTQYYDTQYDTDQQITKFLIASANEYGKAYKGKVWTTDAVLRETKEIINEKIEQGAIAVDMISSAFIGVANFCKKKSAVILTVSDNLVTGKKGFQNSSFFQAEDKMIEAVFNAVELF